MEFSIPTLEYLGQSVVPAAGLCLWIFMVTVSLVAVISTNWHFYLGRLKQAQLAQDRKKRKLLEVVSQKTPSAATERPIEKTSSTLGGTPASKSKRTSSNRSPSTSSFTNVGLEPVSILRPLRGIDSCLEENLVSNFMLDYSAPFEILISVADEKDPAVGVARRVMKRFPNIDAQLYIGQDSVGVNPKINNLVHNYHQTKYDIVWCCDSNVRMDPEALTVAAEHFRDPKVGLVHHAPEGVGANTFGAHLEELFLNTIHARTYLFVNTMGIDSCVIGKSLLWRRSHLERCGGLEIFGKYMAEDNYIGLELMRLGYQHRLSLLTAKQPLDNGTVQDYLLRRMRWTRIRLFAMPVVTLLLEPFVESISNGLLGAYALQHFFGWSFLSVFCIHMLAWLICDIVLVQGLTQTSLLRWPTFPRFLLAWSVRELTAFPVYLMGVLGGRHVTWRGRSYRLHFGGNVVPLDDVSSTALPIPAGSENEKRK